MALTERLVDRLEKMDNPRISDDRSGNEIAEEVIKRLGLKVKE